MGSATDSVSFKQQSQKLEPGVTLLTQAHTTQGLFFHDRDSTKCCNKEFIIEFATYK